MTKLLIQNGRVINPATSYDAVATIAIEDRKIVGLYNPAQVPAGFESATIIDASDCVVLPGLVDLAVRLREPGHEHEGMLESELQAAVVGGVTSVVCLPDTDPVLDEPGLVKMLKFRAANLKRARVFPLGALTRNLKGENLTEMAQLTEAGCVGFSHADVTIFNTQVLQRAFQYASNYGYTVWLRPNDAYLGNGVAASGAIATRLGLSGVPAMAETIAINTVIALMKSTGAKVHLCRLSSADSVELVRQAKAAGLPISADVSINSLFLTDQDIGYFDSRARLTPPLRQQRDRDALQQGLKDGTIDALVSDHYPLERDAKVVPFASATPGASGLELLLSLAYKWGQSQQLSLLETFACVTSQAAKVLGDSVLQAPTTLGQITVGQEADLCIVDLAHNWVVSENSLSSQGKSTPFSGYEIPAKVKHTLVAGLLSYSLPQPV